MTFFSDLKALDPADAELVFERAAIIEYDGNVPRAQAEVLALAELTMRSTGHVPVEIETRSQTDLVSQA
jgi:hypothetical protein